MTDLWDVETLARARKARQRARGMGELFDTLMPQTLPSGIIFEESQSRSHVLGVETMEARTTTPYTNAAILFPLELAVAEHVLGLPPVEPALDRIFSCVTYRGAAMPTAVRDRSMRAGAAAGHAATACERQPRTFRDELADG